VTEFVEARRPYRPLPAQIRFSQPGRPHLRGCQRGLGFDSRRIAQGICLADLDNDGDLDAALNCFQ